MIVILFLLLVVSIVFNMYLYHEIKALKKERDYYIHVDTENEELRKKLAKK